MHIGQINIGDRQHGRLKAESIIDCSPDKNSIITAIEELYSDKFQAMLKTVENPYGKGGASQRIVEALRDTPLENVIKKSFYDLPKKEF